jgi:FkbH-like protein
VTAASLAAAAPAETIPLVSRLLAASPGYDAGLVEAAQEAIERNGLLRDVGLRALLPAGSAWDASASGRWLRARVLDLAGAADEGEAAWGAVVAGGAGPLHEAHLARARLRGARGATAEAYDDLREALLEPREYPFLRRAAKLYRSLRAAQAPAASRAVRLALLSSSTTDLLAPLLPLLASRDGIDMKVYVGPYGNYAQEILDERSGLYAFEPDVVIVATHWRDAKFPPFADDPAARVAACVGEFRRLWETLLERRACTIIQHGFDLPVGDAYGHLSGALAGGRAALLRAATRGLIEAAPTTVQVLDLEEAAADVGRHRWEDASYWHAAKQHPAPDALPSLVERQVALVRASLGLTKKVLVLDLDNTLWGGIVGEDGVDGIQVGPPSAVGEAYAALQRYAKTLKERGIVLAVCSKNNDADARLPFERREEMVLRFDDFAAFQANWQDKPTNLREIARVLNLGLDSFVLLDDNPAERALVRAELPEVAVPEVGPDPAGFVAVLERRRYFEAWAVSVEDRQRAASYRTNVLREELRTSARTIDEFLQGLGMVAEVGPFDESLLARVVQLLGKTNQFNVTTRRHGEQRVRQMIADRRYWTRYFRLSDRFGSHGIIGLMIAARTDDAQPTWEIDTWLMSCRVIGRRVEDCMLATLVGAASAAGVRRIRGWYLATPKNALVRDLYPRFGFREVGRAGQDDVAYELAVVPGVAPRCPFIECRAAAVST